jgi:hypothetical protein
MRGGYSQERINIRIRPAPLEVAASFHAAHERSKTYVVKRGGSLASSPARILCGTPDRKLAGGLTLSKLKHGWRPAIVGGIIGLVMGFMGGAGAGFLEPKPSQTVAIPVLPGSSANGNPSSSAASPTSVPVSKSFANAHVRGGLAGPSEKSKVCGRAGARLVRFRVLVEGGLRTTPAAFVSDLLGVLCDGRSWIGSGKVRFQYDPNGSLLIGLRSPNSTERRCMQLIHLSVNHYYSCGTPREVVLNSDRWFTGSRYWPGTVPVYRQMLVNHEVGHAIGQHHRTCPKDGAAAPVMMQQSKGMTTNGNTCKPNPWPLSYEWRSLRS